MAGQNEHRYLTSGEMVQLLIQNLRECDPDLARFETFLDQFSAENDEFLTNLNDIFVCAVHRQCVELAEILLNRYLTNIDINHRSEDIPGGYCPLTAAARTCNKRLLDLLLKHDADVTVTTISGETALDLVCERGCADCVELILDHVESGRLDAGSKDLVYYGALMTAAFHCRDDILDILLGHGLDVNLNLDEDLGTPLHRAIGGGSLSCVEKLLRAGADVESFRRNVEQTPLMRAAEFGHVDIVRRLLEEGAEVNRVTAECSPALIMACHNGHVECVACLIDHGADVNQKNPWGYTPLFMGADTPAIVRMLLRSGSDADERCGERGEAAIHLASVIGSGETVQTLADGGADVDLTTDHDETALWLAVCKGHVDVSRLLLSLNCRMGVPSNGCRVYAVDYVELELAMGLGRFDIVRMLLRAGCPLLNPAYYRPDEPGPLDDLPWIRLRREALDVQRTRQEQFCWIVDFVSNPRTLKDISTLYIRRVLGVPLNNKLRRLLLPEDLRQYVRLRHFSDW